MGRGSGGSVLHRRIRSRVLGIEKPFSVYLPHEYRSRRRSYPVLYLFRGHETEWINPGQDTSRKGRSVVHLLDDLVRRGDIRPFIVVMPGFASEDHSVLSPGVDMLEPPDDLPGIGSGAFERYFIHELVPAIDAQYRTRADSAHRGADGFSIGGYTSTMLAIRHPGLFSSVGSYDGTFMWYDLYDPRLPGARNNDRIWLRNPLFDPVFGKRRDVRYMKLHNPLNLLARMTDKERKRLHHVRFHLQCAAFDGTEGNRDRTVHFIAHLRKHGIENSFPDPILSARARHNWRYADMHLRRTLRLHDALLQD